MSAAKTPPEIWAEIPGWPGYQVSSRRRVRSLDRIVVDRRGFRRRWRGRLLQQQCNPHGGLYVSLSQPGRTKTYGVNRLWREALEASKPAENGGNAATSNDRCRRHDTEQRKTVDAA